MENQHNLFELNLVHTFLAQGRRKLLRGGAAARVSLYDAAEGSDIEVRSADHSARSAEKKFRLHFQLSGWVLVVLSYFED